MDVEGGIFHRILLFDSFFQFFFLKGRCLKLSHGGREGLGQSVQARRGPCVWGARTEGGGEGFFGKKKINGSDP